MSKTASTSHWDQSSTYHEMRAMDAHAQVEQYIMPFLLEYGRKTGDGTVCDFACGGGAIAQEVMDQTQVAAFRVPRFLLIDVINKNLEAAGGRIAKTAGETRVEGFVCNGNDFSNYSGEKCSLLYCWDAMVHFDIIDVVGYIKTLSNVCKGYGFFHHSNYAGLTTDIQLNPHWRNFMTKDVFKQICVSAGHEVVSQHLINWGENDLDCITVVKAG